MCCGVCAAHIKEEHILPSGKGQLPQPAPTVPVPSSQPDSLVTSLKQSLSSYCNICRKILTIPLTGLRNLKGNLQLFFTLPPSSIFFLVHSQHKKTQKTQKQPKTKTKTKPRKRDHINFYYFYYFYCSSFQKLFETKQAIGNQILKEVNLP